MSDQDREHLPTAPSADEDTHTADVREAIERAKEGVEQSQQATAEAETSVLLPQGEQIEASGLTPEEHAVTHTEAVPPVREPVTITGNVEMPSAAEVPPVQQTVPEQAPIVITPDHPMAALYMQQPDPPEIKSNRLAGLFISLLATLGFGVVYAGGIALWLARQYPPSTFLQEGLYPYLASLGFVIPVTVFFVSMVILVMIFNRAGWWAYAIFGVLVAALVWLGAGAGYSMSPQLLEGGGAVQYDVRRYLEFALTIPSLIAALAARESAVWFGAWIGARGRRCKAKNQVAQQEYEEKLAELRVPQVP